MWPEAPVSIARDAESAAQRADHTDPYLSAVGMRCTVWPARRVSSGPGSLVGTLRDSLWIRRADFLFVHRLSYTPALDVGSADDVVELAILSAG
jgi:hypothetical protein